MREIIAVARRALTLVGAGTRRRMLTLPVIALTVSAFEVVGAGAIYVLLGLLDGPDMVIDLAPVRLLAGLLDSATTATGLRELRFTVAGLVLAGYPSLPYRFHATRDSAASSSATRT